MPWLALHYKNSPREALIKKFEIVGVPLCIAIETQSGLIVSKKARVDIFDMGIECLKHWRNAIPAIKAKEEHLQNGAVIVEKQRIEREAEEKRKRDLEKELE